MSTINERYSTCLTLTFHEIIAQYHKEEDKKIGISQDLAFSLPIPTRLACFNLLFIAIDTQAKNVVGIIKVRGR
jgi:hypothetical protein